MSRPVVLLEEDDESKPGAETAENVDAVVPSFGPQEFRVYRRRWVCLFVLSMQNISNAMLWISFAPIERKVEAYYDVSDVLVNSLSVVYMIAFVPLGFTSCWILDSYGLRLGTFLAVGFNVVGAWMRYLGDFETTPTARFAVLFVGQCLCACAQPFLVSAPTKLAADWFAPKQRAFANMLATMSNPVGIALGSLVSPLLVSDPSDIPTMNLAFAIFATVVGLSVFLMHSVPPTPPSASAAAPATPFLIGLKELFRIRDYVLIFLASGLGLGIFNSLSTLLAQIMYPNGYNDDDAGFAGAALIVAGLLGALVSSLLADKTGQFKLLAKTLFVSAALLLVWFALAQRPDMYAMIVVVCALLGVSFIGVLPLALELGVECSYPIAEATSAGFLWMNGNIWGVFIIYAMNAMKDPLTGDLISACWLVAALGAVMAGLMLLYRAPYRRRIAEAHYNDAKSMVSINAGANAAAASAADNSHDDCSSRQNMSTPHVVLQE